MREPEAPVEVAEQACAHTQATAPSKEMQLQVCETPLTQRVTKSNCPSIGIDPLGVQMQLLGHCQALSGKGLVHLHTHTAGGGG